MGRIFKVGFSGGGGGSSDELTALKSDVLKGKTAVTSDSNDEPISGTLETMGGVTVNPSKSSQTISCAGKVLTSNIVINRIPSSYISVSGGSYLINGATLGPLVNRGVTNTAPRRSGGTLIQQFTGYNYLWGNCGVASWRNYELATVSSGKYYFGGYYTGDSLAFKGSIDLTPFSKCTVSVHMTANSTAEFVFSILNLSKNTIVRCLNIELHYVSGGNAVADYTYDIPLSGINGHHYICMYGYHGNGIGGTQINYLRLS